MNRMEVNELLRELQEYRNDLYKQKEKSTEKNKNKIKKDLGLISDMQKVFNAENNNHLDSNTISSKSNDKLELKIKNYEFVSNISNIEYKSSMIVEFLTKIIQLDKSLNFYKQKLVSKEDFSINLLFDSFNIFNSNCISISDFQEVLTDLNIQSSIRDLKLLFKRYDYDLDGKLNKDEFCELFFIVDVTDILDVNAKNSKNYLKKERKSSSYLNNNTSDKNHIMNYNNEIKPLSQETKDMLVEVLILAIEVEREAERLKLILHQDKEFSVVELFELIRCVNNMNTPNTINYTGNNYSKNDNERNINLENVS